MIEAVTYSPEHFAELEPRECHTEEVRADILPFPLHTFLIKKIPIAIFGGVFVSERQFNAWALLSEGITQYPIEFIRKTKRLLDSYMDMYNLERLEISVRKDFQRGLRFASSLGFSINGARPLHNQNGIDYVVLERVKWPM